jgi:hypothetical protein
MAADTLLVITGVGLPSWSARGLNQTLAPIEASAQMRRTVNGELLDISYLPFQKYGSKITCDDLRIPAIDGVWPGDEVTVECVAELSYPTGGTAQRPAVPGSSRTEGGFVFYRPILVMLVKNIETQTDEWGATMQWTIDCEEK